MEARMPEPALIPRKVLFGNPERALPQISPGGERLAYLAPSPEGVLNVWVKCLEAEDDRQLSADAGNGIQVYCWAPDGRRLFYFQDRQGDDALNHRISPLYHAARIRAPLLIGHGANDPRVPLAQSEAIVRTIREDGREASLVVYPDEGHGFSRPGNNLAFFGRVEEYLARHLGGRCQPWRPVIGASAQVDEG
jgi:pimeloyl-ACP methyl ester carboxylesterase